MLNIGDEMMIVRFGKVGCACAQLHAPGQLTKLSRLRDTPSRRVAEPNFQKATPLSLREGGGHHVGHHVPMVVVVVRVKQDVPLPNITRENENGCADCGGIRRNPKRHGTFGHPAPG